MHTQLFYLYTQTQFLSKTVLGNRANPKVSILYTMGLITLKIIVSAQTNLQKSYKVLYFYMKPTTYVIIIHMSEQHFALFAAGK